jgi:ubiquinone biosynthesis protein COQ4
MSASANDNSLEFGPFPEQRIRPLATLAAATRLFLNTQDTRQVALLEMAIGGYSHKDVFERFIQSETGRTVIRERRSLVDVLDDHAYLRSLPLNSLGRRYLAHMEHEGLTVQGLLDATPAVTAYVNRQSDAVRLFLNYAVRCSHDLHHVLAGYGRDEVGEACVVAMAYEQIRIRGYRPIFMLGPFAIRKQLKRLKIGRSGVFAAVREARRIGREAAWFPGLDIASILGEDIDILRRRLNIREPLIYNEIIARVRAGCAWQSGPLVLVPTPG